MQAKILTTIAAGVLGALATAQGPATVTVFPGDHATNEGFSWENAPFGLGISRVQTLHEQADLQIPNGASISRIGFRQDEGFALSGQQLQLEIKMGKSKLGATTMTNNFAGNYDGTPITVYSKKVFALPNFPKPAQGPSPNVVWVPLDQPYVHDASENLIVEILVYANSNGNGAFTYPMDLARYYAPVEKLGNGCSSSGGKVADLTSGDPVINTNWLLFGRSAPASSNVFIIAGVSRPQPLPLDFVGMPNCSLYVNELGCLAGGTTNAAGAVNITLQIPDRLTMYGDRMAFQLVVEDPFANAAGLVASNGIDVQFGIVPRGSMVRATGSTTAATGSLLRNHGLVTLFDHQ